jgi:preprotein translocase subunit SecF
MLWGIVIGTYSSLFIAAPLLYYIRPGRKTRGEEEEGKALAAGAQRGPSP